MRKRSGGASKFPPLPCGCKASARIPANVVVLVDGTRVCRHGKRWRLAWQMVEKTK